MKLNRRAVLSFLAVVMVSPVGAVINYNLTALGSKSPKSAELKRLRKSLFNNVNKQDLISVYKIPKIKIMETLSLSKTTSEHTFLAIKEDFELRRVCVIDGWVLSQTEVILCLMT
jgi:hypothetical protein